MLHSKRVLDFCASHHMSLDSLCFASGSPSLSIIVMIVVDGTLMPLTSVGFVVTSHFSPLNVYLVLLVSYVII